VKIIHASVTGVRRGLREGDHRRIYLEWIEDRNEPVIFYTSMELRDDEGEFSMGDKIAMTLTKVMGEKGE
jgi:hypothetical protein